MSETYEVDKTGWPEGPWMSEPDHAQWITEAGFDGLLVRGPSGALCGYVGVPETHWAFGMHYDEVHERFGDWDSDDQLTVHGGLTYANKCSGSICHAGPDIANATVWWLGFDCAHSGDFCPKYGRELGWRARYKGEGFVRREVEKLATRLTEER